MSDLASRSGAKSRDVPQALRDDHEHGASWLAREAVHALAEVASQAGDAAERVDAVRMLARELAQARPSMAAIAMTVARVWWQAQSTASGDADAQLIAVRAAANVTERRWDSAVAGMTAWARTAAHGPVLTLSRSASVEGVLIALSRERASGDPLRVVVCESRPGGEGVALAAALAGAGALVTLIPDSAVAACVDDVGCVMLGADSVRADGSVLNKVGSRIVALVAQSASKPVYALAESLKVTAASYPLVIECADLTTALPPPAPGVTSHSPLFERIPPPLITQIITEAGALTGAEVARLAAEAERAYTELMRP